MDLLYIAAALALVAVTAALIAGCDRLGGRP